MKLINLGESDSTKPGEYIDWKRRIIEITKTQDFDTNSG